MKSLLKLITFLFISLLLFTNFACDVSSSSDSSTTTYSDLEVDSLFNVLVERAIMLEDAEYVEDVTIINFKELADAFNAIVLQDSKNVKGNVGYIVASVLALNSNSELKKIADSLDLYFSGVDDYLSSRSDKQRTLKIARVLNREKKSSYIRKSYDDAGMTGMSIALLSRLPELVMRQSQMPSFPEFITISHIQDLIESSVIPVLNNVQQAFERLESVNGELIFTVEGDSVKLDKSDFYIVDAGVLLLRSGLSVFTAYDWDVYTSASDQTYSWISELIKLEDEIEYVDVTKYSLNGDTLITTDSSYYKNELEFYQYLYDVSKYNYKRSSFLTIKRENHSKAYSDIKGAVAKLKSAVSSLENETGAQDYDLIKKVDFDELKTDFVDIEADMKEDGFSATFASNFKSPTSLLNFLETILTSSYTFNETIDNVNIEIVVDISKFFTNPIDDWKDFYPKHKVRDRDSIFEESGSNSLSNPVNAFSDNKIYIDTYADTVIIDIPENKIESISGNYIYLKESYSYSYYTSSSRYLYYMPIDFIDYNGNILDWDMYWEDESLGGWVLPYFDDYTINGIFPEMTRAKWTELIKDIDYWL